MSYSWNHTVCSLFRLASLNHYINDRELTPEEQKIAKELGFRAVDAVAEQGEAATTNETKKDETVTTANPGVADPQRVRREFERLKKAYQRDQEERAYRERNKGAVWYISTGVAKAPASNRLLRENRK